MNFGKISDEKFNLFDPARILILPVSYRLNDFGRADHSVSEIIKASQHLELYDEETDAEVYKIGIHTLDESIRSETLTELMTNLYEQTQKLLKFEKFVCLLGGEHFVSAPVIRAHAEKFHNLSVLQIDARADLCNFSPESPSSSVMNYVLKDLRIPAVQIGIRSISADEIRLHDDGLPTKIYWAREIAGRTDWIDEAIENLTENVYLTIDAAGFDSSVLPAPGMPEPGGLGWYQTLTLLRKLAEKRRIVGMDFVEYTHDENQLSQAFVCAKLIYKVFGYIFRDEAPKVIGI